MNPLTYRYCRHVVKRLDVLLDRDPSAPLDPQEIADLEAHLAWCEHCVEIAEQHRALHRSLRRIGLGLAPDQATVDRARDALLRALQDADSQ